MRFFFVRLWRLGEGDSGVRGFVSARDQAVLVKFLFQVLRLCYQVKLTR